MCLLHARFAATRKCDGQIFACKQLELGRLTSTGLAQLHEEVTAMRSMDHPGICRLREVFYSDRRRFLDPAPRASFSLFLLLSFHFESQALTPLLGHRCYLVMELCGGGELFDALERASQSQRTARPFAI